MIYQCVIYHNVINMRKFKPDTVNRIIKILAEAKKEGRARSRVAFDHGFFPENLSRDIKDLKENLKFWKKVGGIIEGQGLLENGNWVKIGQKVLQTKIAKAKKGYYYGPSVIGYTQKGGRLFENEDLKRVDGVFEDLKDGDPPADVAREHGFSLDQLRKITRSNVSIVYTGYSIFMDKENKGHWKPLITPEELKEIQRRLPAHTGGRLFWGYQWLDDKQVLKPGMKEIYARIFDLRKKKRTHLEIVEEIKETFKEIVDELSFSRRVVSKMFKEEKITGKIEVDGEFVDSGYEQAIDRKTWDDVQKLKVPTGPEKIAQKREERKAKVLNYVPAYLWELIEKLGVTHDTVHEYTQELMPFYLKKREDGLFQKIWEPYPERRLEKRVKSLALKRIRIVKLLRSKREGLTLKEISHETNIPYSNTAHVANGLFKDGFVERKENKVRLSEIGLATLKDRLKLPKLSTS